MSEKESTSAGAEESETLQERIKALLASGDTQTVIELFASIETRADAAVEEADALGEKVRKLKYVNKHLTLLRVMTSGTL